MTAPANPLVAERVDSTEWYTGLGIGEGIADLVNGIESGSWVDTTIGGLATSMEALGLVLDPIGSLVSYGVSWLMEHVKPVSDALDWLAGDPDQIAANAQTWRNVAEHAAKAAADLRTAVAGELAEWAGPAATAYRTNVGIQIDALGSAAQSANGIGSAVEGAGLLVALVRELVRDLIADLVSVLVARIPLWAAEAGLTLGIASPWVVAQASSLIAKWVAKISDLLLGLVRSISKLMPMLRQLDDIFAQLWSAFRRAASGTGFGGGGGAPDVGPQMPQTPQMPHVPATPAGPAVPPGPAAPPPPPAGGGGYGGGGGGYGGGGGGGYGGGGAPAPPSPPPVPTPAPAPAPMPVPEPSLAGVGDPAGTPTPTTTPPGTVYSSANNPQLAGVSPPPGAVAAPPGTPDLSPPAGTSPGSGPGSPPPGAVYGSPQNPPPGGLYGTPQNPGGSPPGTVYGNPQSSAGSPPPGGLYGTPQGPPGSAPPWAVHGPPPSVSPDGLAGAPQPGTTPGGQPGPTPGTVSGSPSTSTPPGTVYGTPQQPSVGDLPGSPYQPPAAGTPGGTPAGTPGMPSAPDGPAAPHGTPPGVPHGTTPGSPPTPGTTPEVPTPGASGTSPTAGAPGAPTGTVPGGPAPTPDLAHTPNAPSTGPGAPDPGTGPGTGGTSPSSPGSPTPGGPTAGTPGTTPGTSPGAPVLNDLDKLKALDPQPPVDPLDKLKVLDPGGPSDGPGHAPAHPDGPGDGPAHPDGQNNPPETDNQSPDQNGDNVDGDQPADSDGGVTPDPEEVVGPHGLTRADRAALDHYTGSGHRELNEYLRGSEGWWPNREIHQGHADALSKALEKLPSEAGTFWRGTGLEDSVLKSYEQNGLVTERAFSSSSLDYKTAEDFAGTPNSRAVKDETPVIMQIDAANGKHVDPFSVNRGEAEMLFDQGTEFYVNERTFERGYVRLHLIEVTPENRKDIMDLMERRRTETQGGTS